MDARGPKTLETLDTTLARSLQSLHISQPIAVALSGGPDSSALALAMDRWCRHHDHALYLFHIHHGLSESADAWQTQAQSLAEHLGRPMIVRRVDVDLQSGLGLEAAARQARYDAIHDIARANGVQTVVLGHHQQDQAETVLMRLFRGAGVQGLAAMAGRRRERGLDWVRPWLDVPRQDILDYLAVFTNRTGWLPVDDPSNADDRLARGTLRSQVIPAIESHWPAWRLTLVRHAKQSAQASRLLERYGQRLLREIQVQDDEGVQADASLSASVLSLAKWREFVADEQVLVLRTWLSQAGMQMPTDKRLNELVRQLNGVHALGHDRALKWTQRDCEVRCIRGQLHLQATL